MKKFLSCLLAAVLAVVAMHAASPSGTLPVLHINTENNAPILTKTDYVQASYYLDPNGDADIKAIGSEAEPLPLQIRGRGNYTWIGFDKKPYRLKLGKKQALMGMNKSKHWALLAHADDSKGFLRNAVGFQLSRLIGLPWTPGDAPVEVVLNGEYIGLYFLTETVRVDDTRVNIYNYDSAIEDAEDALAEATDDNRAELQAALEAARNAEPAWLLEIDNYDDEDQVQFPESNPNILKEEDKNLRFTYDNPCDYITEELRQGLINEMAEIDRMIYTADKTNCAWAEKIDLTDLAKFFVVNQIVGNYESFHGSCKLFRDNAAHAAESGTDTKWHFSPVWDFGSAFQDSANLGDWLYNGEYYNHWIGEMMKFPAFKTEVDRVYADFMNGSYNEIYDYINTFATKISAAADSDRQRWPQYGNSDIAGKANDVTSKLRTSVSYLNTALNFSGGGDDVEAPTNDIYLRGEITGWDANDNYRFTAKGNNIYTLEIASLSGTFKIAGPEWNVGNVDFGCGGTVNVNTPVTLTYQGRDCSVDGTIENPVLTFDWNTKTLTITTSGNIGGGDDVEAPTNDIYLRGDVTGWEANESYRFTAKGNNIYTLSIPSLYKAFKIAGPEWNVGNVDYGCGSVIEIDTPMQLSLNGSNCSVTGTIDNPTLTFDWSTKTLTITTSGNIGGGDDDDNNYVVYFHDKSATPWETAYIYVWKDGAFAAGEWPGAKMEDITITANRAVTPRYVIGSTDKIWKYTFATNVSGHSLIFNNGSGGAGNQTDNINDLATNHVYTNDGSHTAFDGVITGIESVNAIEALSVAVHAGRLVINTPEACELTVARIDGMTFTLGLTAGSNYFDLPRGFYIIAGRKFAL